MTRAFVALLVGACLTSCASFHSSPSETLAQGVYATADAMDAGRFDLADKYIHGVTRQIAPPKKRISIKPIE